MAAEDQSRLGQARQAAKTAKQVKEIAQVGRAAVLLANPAVWIAGIVAFVFVLVILLLGIVFLGVAGGSTGGGGGTTQPAAGGFGGTCGEPSGTPKNVIDKVILPIAHQIDFEHVTPESVDAANAAHSTSTTSGNVSEHKGPPEVAWAADISNTASQAEDESSMTPEMGQLAKAIAECFNIKWSGRGLVNGYSGGYRFQLIYGVGGDENGGNHFNHVHIGVSKQ